MMSVMDQKFVWLADYTDSDIDAYSRILDLGLPLAYGFVIPRSVLHTVYLNLGVQEKLIPLFEFSHDDNSAEVVHVQELIQKIVENIKVPKDFLKQIHSAYEQMLEKEKKYLKIHVSDLHRAVHILRHIYYPPAVNVSFLPYSNISLSCAGEQSLLHSITLAIIEYLKQSVAKGQSIDVPSIVVQRMQNGQYSGYCETINKMRANNQQIVVYSNIGAQILEESGDVYIMDKDTMHIAHRHVLTQPYKYSLRGLQYKKVPIHEEEGKRQVLADSIIMKIGYLAKDIEKKLYFPQKIYWTMENGILYVTRLKQI